MVALELALGSGFATGPGLHVARTPAATKASTRWNERRELTTSP
jgi:hypothetical protein